MSVPIAEVELRETYLAPMPGVKTEFTVWDDKGQIVGLLGFSAVSRAGVDEVLAELSKTIDRHRGRPTPLLFGT